MNRKTLPLDKIHTDGGTQARAALNEDVVAEYAEVVTAGDDLPPVVVFHDGKKNWLADGFHRFHAYRKAGAIQIDADVRVGTRRDAILYSVGANAAHGLRRTNEDKRHAVRTLLADKEWGAWSDRQIADACGVSHPFVAAMRKPERAAKQQESRDASAARKGDPENVASDPSKAPPSSAPTVESDEAPARAAAGAPDIAPAAPLDPAENEEPEADDFIEIPHEDEEHEESEVDELRRQVAELTDLLNGFDKASEGEAAAAAEISRLSRQVDVVASQRDQYMRTCNELKKTVKSLQRENARLKAMVPAEAA